jgi:putrescine aminotransferase
MHSTTYNGFGEETYTALVALEVALAENFEKRAKDIGSTFEDGLTNLKSKNSTLKNFEGMGTLYGLEFDISKSFKTIEKSLNTNNLKFINKVHVGSIIDELYREHNILTYFTDNKRVCLAVSPSNIATIDDVKYFIETLDNVLSQNQTKLILKFVKNVSLENIKLLFL